MPIPPGIRFISGLLSSLLPQFLVLAASYYVASRVYQVHIPVYAVPLLLIAKMLVSSAWTRAYHSRERARLGAISPPRIKYTLPGGLDLVPKIVKGLKLEYIGDLADVMREEYGNIYDIWMTFESRVLTCEPDHIKAILATEFDSFGKGDRFKKQAHSVLGFGVFNSDGDMWKFHRSMTRPFFSKDRVIHFEMFQRHADEVIQLMAERLSQDPTQAVDFQDAMSRFTLDSATEFLFGHCVHSLETGLPYSPELKQNENLDFSAAQEHPANRFAASFANVQEALVERSGYGRLWQLREFWKYKTDDDMAVIGKFIDPIIEKAVANKANGAKSNKEVDVDSDNITLLDHLVNYTDDPVILKDETLNIMIAGRDTTASTLTFVTYALALHPNVLGKLRAEILSVVGPTRCPSYDDMREMKYLRAVINETLRLFPPVPFNSREAVKPILFSNKNGKPYYVPAHTKTPYSVLLMHRRKDLWGPDALEFDPDRFLDDRLQKYLVPNPFIFLPFNAGPRICLGQKFAYNEASFMLVRLLQTFDKIELAPDAQPVDSLPPKEWAEISRGRFSVEKIWPKSHLTMYAQGGLWIRLGRAEGRHDHQ